MRFFVAKPTYLILLRHGESMWNKENLFTGWVDVPLSPKGIQEAFEAGKILDSYDIDVVFTSSLIRGIMTAMIALSHKPEKTPVIFHPDGRMHAWGKIYSEKSIKNILPVYQNEALNERMYGRLQGLNKKETADTYGDEQVHTWRRSYSVCPPDGESLEMTLERTLPYFESAILPVLQDGKTVLVSAHGNSLRAIIKHIEKLSDDEIVRYELATGVPITYAFTDGAFTKSR
jgi:2,3-bisphosphoglycerate-dependent phosphoglycerate mutase